MSDGGVTLAIVMSVQAVALALVSRVRWRCHEDGTCTSGCTEFSLIPSSETVDCQEFQIGTDQKVLVILSKR